MQPLLHLESILNEHIAVFEASKNLLDPLRKIAQKTSLHIQKGHKIFFCGNGGSAADAQHMAAELIGRFYQERKAIPAIALTTDSSILTCLGNDYHYDIIFSRQLEALCDADDIVVLLSTSGKSTNILKAAECARHKKAYTIGLTGKDGGTLKDLVDDCLIVPSQNTPRIQEAHVFLGHILCEWIEMSVSKEVL